MLCLLTLSEIPPKSTWVNRRIKQQALQFHNAPDREKEKGGKKIVIRGKLREHDIRSRKIYVGF